jgi:hypothetical protein
MPYRILGQAWIGGRHHTEAQYCIRAFTVSIRPYKILTKHGGARPQNLEPKSWNTQAYYDIAMAMATQLTNAYQNAMQEGKEVLASMYKSGRPTYTGKKEV